MVYTGSQEKFVHDFVAAWNKVQRVCAKVCEGLPGEVLRQIGFASPVTAGRSRLLWLSGREQSNQAYYSCPSEELWRVFN